jgi:hypothetical protein
MPSCVHREPDRHSFYQNGNWNERVRAARELMARTGAANRQNCQTPKGTVASNLINDCAERWPQSLEKRMHVDSCAYVALG